MSTSSKRPWHLWVVGIVSLLWNAMGAFNYLMTETRNEAYLSEYTPEQLEYFTSYPAWAVAFWAIAVWGSLVGSVLLLLGLLGRFAAITLFIAMMIATFVHHFGDPWSSKELPLLYAVVYATLAFTGPGSPSFDAWFSRQVFEKEGPSAPKPRRAEPGAPT